MTIVPDWLDQVDISDAMRPSVFGTCARLKEVLGVAAAKAGQCIYRTYRGGKTELTVDTMEEALIEDFDAVLIEMSLDKRRSEGGEQVFVLPHGLVSVDWNSNCFAYYGTSIKEAGHCYDFALKHYDEQADKGSVHVIIRTMEGFETKVLGVAGVDLETNNYGKKVLADYQHVVADLQSVDPCGRLVLLDGPPGTGKTYLVRALLKSCPEATFVLLPPQLTSDLAGPDLVMCMSNVRNNTAKKGPVVLIIEDGEKCLLPRSGDNDTAVTSMLNICDGIFGTVVDMRVLVTTNEPNEAVDAALKRSGRLCRSLHVGELPAEQAQQVFERLVNPPGGSYRSEDPDPKFDRSIPLCDVYRLARDRGWCPEVAPAGAGFHLRQDMENHAPTPPIAGRS